MLLIDCPYCGPRAQAEFIFERPVETIVAIDAAPAEALQRLYTRTNPRGVSAELWRHSFGCHAWLRIERDTVTHVIAAVAAWRSAP